MPQTRMKCFRLVFDHLAWIEHQFLSGIRDSRKARSLWRMMKGVGSVRKSIHQSRIPTGQTVNKEFYVEVLREFRKRFLGKRPALFKSAQWHFHEDNAPVHNSILVTDYLSKMGIKTVPQPLYSPHFALCDFWLFPNLRGCRYETIEDMKGHWHAHTRGLRWGLEFHVFTINKTDHPKKVWILNVCSLYINVIYPEVAII